MSVSVVKLHAFAPAKINLSLKLVGKRADGYHLLDSIFVPFRALFDELTLELSDGEPSVTISSNLSEMTDAESNLCSKAAKLYFETTDIHPSCHIHLEKNIPIGAGLGGGSSDCAAVLSMLNSHYCKLSAAELHDLALLLGADVPFFLVNKISRVGGIGEKIEPLKTSLKLPLVVFSPSFSISTPWAFKHINPSIIGIDSSESTSKIVVALQNDDILTASKYLHNDFETLVFGKFPAYFIWKEFLLKCGALHVGLSGSGSSFFAVFDNSNILENAKEKFYKKYGQNFK